MRGGSISFVGGTPASFRLVKKNRRATMNLAKKTRKAARIWRRKIFEHLGSDRYSHVALNDLDRKLAQYFSFRNGTFIEAGANDGITQSNTYWFERFRGWRGVLIEAVPDKAAECRRNHPNERRGNAAL